MKKRILIVIIFFLCIFSALIVKLGYITFISSNRINILADELWKRDIPIQSSRGLIYDRNGKLIVGNKLAYTVASINKKVKDKDLAAKTLAEILNAEESAILKHLNKNNSLEIIKPEGRRITDEQAKLINQANLEGIYLTADSKRYYPYGSTLGQVLGFCGIDMEGLSGIEYQYEDFLKSQDGALSIYTDAKGNLMHNTTSVYSSATPGMNIYLTIDLDLQLILDGVINNAITQYNPDQVMGLIVDTSNDFIPLF